MKIYIIMLGIVLVSLVKKKNEDLNKNQIKKSEIQNIENFYTIQYEKHPNVTLDKNLNLNENEEKIISLFKSTNSIHKYSIRVFGGWVKDKLIGRTPRDMDILIDCMTIENLNQTIVEVFEILKIQYPDEDLKNENKFKLPYEFREYGFMRITLFGIIIDIEILASNRKIVPPYVKTNYLNLKRLFFRTLHPLMT
jgi:hypothetical protein